MGTEPRLGSKVFYKIGEVSKFRSCRLMCSRFWESEFSFLKPKKSRGNQRLYVQRDVDTVLEIKRMLYDEGHTLAGVKRYWATSRTSDVTPDAPKELANTSEAISRRLLECSTRIRHERRVRLTNAVLAHREDDRTPSKVGA